ncbi:MAG: glycosyltransferase [Planctomycetota bacterium]
MTGKPRIVLVAYYYPPSSAIGGVRAENIAQQLANLGWHVTVITPTLKFWGGNEAEPFPGVEVVRVDSGWSLLGPEGPMDRQGIPLKVISKLFQKSIRNIKKLEPTSYWTRSALKALREHAADSDILMTTMSPFFTGGIVAEIAQEFKIPFVLDYRDLIIGNAHGMYLSQNSDFIKQELDWLNQASVVTTVSDYLVKLLAERVDDPNKCYSLTNGYSSDQFDRIQFPDRKSEPFRMIYAGTFYPPLAIIDPIFAALAKLDSEKRITSQWKFDYFGTWWETVKNKAKEFKIESHVNVTPLVPRQQALEELANSDCLTVIVSVEGQSNDEVRGIVTAKLFDCLGLKKPILLIAPDGEAADIVHQTDSGFICRGDQIDKIANSIQRIADGHSFEFQSDAYSWNALGIKLDNLLKSAIIS